MAEPQSPPILEQDLACIAALDVGERRIGVALSDALGFTAQPLLTYNRSTAKSDTRRDAKSLLRLLRKQGCRRIIVGKPLYLSGSAGPAMARVDRFVALLRAETSLPIELWDERLSTTEAHQLLDAAGHAVRGRETVIDQVAATLILKSYMEAHRPPALLAQPW